MFKSILVGTLLALGLAGSVTAEPFDDYLEFCLKPEANAQAAGSAAQAAGWFKVPSEVYSEEEVPFQDPSAWLNFDIYEVSDKPPPSDVRIMLTGWGQDEEVFEIEGMRLDFCMVGVMSGDFADLRARMVAHFDFDPVMAGGEDVWAWSRQGARLQSEAAIFAEGSDPNVAAQGRKIFLAGVTEEEGMVMLIMGSMRPAN